MQEKTVSIIKYLYNDSDCYYWIHSDSRYSFVEPVC